MFVPTRQQAGRGGRAQHSLLAERVAEVVRRVCGNNQHALSHHRELHRQRARRRSLADAALASHKNPTHRSRLYKILQRRRHRLQALLIATHVGEQASISRLRSVRAPTASETLARKLSLAVALASRRVGLRWIFDSHAGGRKAPRAGPSDPNQGQCEAGLLCALTTVSGVGYATCTRS